MIKQFKSFLLKSNLAPNTIDSYVWTVRYFLEKYPVINKPNLMAYKNFLLDKYKAQTVNLRLQAINKYLDFVKRGSLKMSFVKVQQKNFLEHVISHADYLFLKAQLKKDGYQDWYFLVWFLTATGARVSELIQIKAEHLTQGYLDIYSKGGKEVRYAAYTFPSSCVRKVACGLRKRGSLRAISFLIALANVSLHGVSPNSSRSLLISTSLILR